MEAYDAAVLSYALATAAGKLKPGLLGVPSITSTHHAVMQPHKHNEEVSHTPPMRQQTRAEENVEQRGLLYELLCSLEQAFVNKGIVQLSQLLDICSCKQVLRTEILANRKVFFELSFLQTEANAIVPLLESLQTELRAACKVNPNSNHRLQLSHDSMFFMLHCK